MRKIKFRAWDGYQIHYNVAILEGVAIKRGYAATSWHAGAKAGKPMQYTGIKDKNGVEIYEGDIVEQYHPFYKLHIEKTKEELGEHYEHYHSSEYKDQMRSGRRKCVWNGGRFEYQALEEKCSGLLTLNNDSQHVEVIGNIHENPELLENE